MSPTEWADDPTIPDDEFLWRRIPPSQIIPALTSAAFRPSDEMSVDMASLTTIEKVLAEYPDYSLAQFTAAQARSVGCKIIRDPLPDNPAHALVLGNNPDRRLTKSQAKSIKNFVTIIKLGTPS